MTLKSRLVCICSLILTVMVSGQAQLKPITAPAGLSPAFPIEVITISRFGVYPAKITRPQGPFVLFIENRLGNHTESFTLVPDGKTIALLALSTSNGKASDHVAMDLQPGTYHLKLVNNANLSADVEITK